LSGSHSVIIVGQRNLQKGESIIINMSARGGNP
jgi:hypothetical protein